MKNTMPLAWLVAFGATVLWLVTLLAALQTADVLQQTLNNIAQ